jgi:putative transcriptional regulator
MSEGEYLAGRLLLAMPGMGDPRFDRSVIAMCVHDENGAFGVNVGHLREGVRFRELLGEVGIESKSVPDRGVLHGGPVEPGRGFVLHSTDWGGLGTIEVKPLGALSASLDVLKAIAQGTGPSRWLFVLGYAGWAPGQLEGEMRRHGWYAAAGRPEILFDNEADSRWAATWRAEGIDPALLANVTGRA